MSETTESHFNLNGRVLDGRYRVDRPLDEGGMGAVFLAHDLKLNKPVVVKIPFPELLVSAQIRQRFEAETDFLIELDHPHIVKVWDKGVVDLVPYVVLQYLRGGSLKDRLAARGGKMTLAEVLEWLEPISGAVDFIHSQDRIHRDIKPGNILFDAQGNSFLADFGIAKALEQEGVTRTGTMPGSPAYMAPEALKGQFTPKYDQYALATVVYECLAGKLPFDGRDHASLFMQKSVQDPESLGLHGNLRRGLNRDPALRFDSCVEFAAALRGCVGRPPSATPVEATGSGAATRLEVPTRQPATATTARTAAAGTAAATTAAPPTEMIGIPGRDGQRSRKPWYIAGGLGLAATLVAAFMLWPSREKTPPPPEPQPALPGDAPTTTLLVYDGSALVPLSDCGAAAIDFPVRLGFDAAVGASVRDDLLRRFAFAGAAGAGCDVDGKIAPVGSDRFELADRDGLRMTNEVAAAELQRPLESLHFERMLLGPGGGDDSLSVVLDPPYVAGQAVNLVVSSNRFEHLLLLTIDSAGQITVVSRDPELVAQASGSARSWRPRRLFFVKSRRDTLIAVAAEEPWSALLDELGVPEANPLLDIGIPTLDEASTPSARALALAVSNRLRSTTQWQRGSRTYSVD